MITRFVVPLALAVLGGVAAQSRDADPGFQAAGVTRTGHLQFEAGISTVFPLFTPQGERHWAKGWDPHVLYPRDREVAEGMVFQTRDGEVLLTWTLVRYDEANHTVLYNVVTPDSLVRTIQVRCRQAGPARTDVEVTDSYVGLSPQGNDFIEHLTEGNYAAKMAHWKESIGSYLAANAGTR